MTEHRKQLGARLSKLGMHFDSEQLARVEAQVHQSADSHHDLADISLMTVAVEGYRNPERDLTEVV